MAVPNPARDVASYLSGAGLGLSLAGGTLFYAPEMPANPTVTGVPVIATFVAQYGGAPPMPYLGTGVNQWEYRVQIVTRTSMENYPTGLALARSINAAVHLATITDQANSAAYLSCYALQSDPIYIGPNEMEQPRWAINVRLLQDR